MTKRAIKGASVEISLESYGRILDRIIKLTEENEKLKEGRHAYWIISIPPSISLELDFICSSCGMHSWFHSRYCPNCGAIMDGERK